MDEERLKLVIEHAVKARDSCNNGFILFDCMYRKLRHEGCDLSSEEVSAIKSFVDDMIEVISSAECVLALYEPNDDLPAYQIGSSVAITDKG